MKINKLLILFVSILFCFTFISLKTTFAQEVSSDEGQKITEQEATSTESKKLEAVAGENKNAAIGRKVLFDASKSVNPLNTKMKYTWDFGDSTKAEGIDVTHIYENAGDYQVILTVDNGKGQNTDIVTVSVYEDLIVLITDKSIAKEKVTELERYSAKQGILLVIIEDRGGKADYTVEGDLTKKLLEQQEDLKKSDIVICWIDGSTGLNILSRFAQQSEILSDLDFAHKGIVNVTPKSFSALSRIAQSTFDVLKPEYILLTKDSALHAVIDARSSDKVIEEVQKSGVEYNIIGVHSERTVKKLGVTNFVSYIVNFMINKGVPIETIFLILMLPVIATIIAFSRQVLGIKAFGIYTPTIITLSFLAMGLKYGLVIFIVILIAGTLIRLILKYFRLLYLPRMAIVLTALAITIFAMFTAGAYTQKTGFIAISIFPILIITTLVEKFVAVQIEKGAGTAIRLSLETIIISIICYYLVNWEPLKTFILAYPEVILVTIIINILLGKWTGLRLSEYFRFRKIAKQTKEQDQ